jgi:hypothetical protein
MGFIFVEKPLPKNPLGPDHKELWDY